MLKHVASPIGNVNRENMRQKAKKQPSCATPSPAYGRRQVALFCAYAPKRGARAPSGLSCSSIPTFAGASGEANGSRPIGSNGFRDGTGGVRQIHGISDSRPKRRAGESRCYRARDPYHRRSGRLRAAGTNRAPQKHIAWGINPGRAEALCRTYRSQRPRFQGGSARPCPASLLRYPKIGRQASASRPRPSNAPRR
jgi:hypothetical protein